MIPNNLPFEPTFENLPKLVAFLVQQNQMLVNMVSELREELEEIKLVSSPIVGIKEAQKFLYTDDQILMKKFQSGELKGGVKVGGKWKVDLAVAKKSMMQYEQNRKVA